MRQNTILEKDFHTSMTDIVIPLLNSLESSGYINGEDNMRIFYKKYVLKNSKGTIVISHGFKEFIEKYSELIYYFIMDGFSVYIHEHRGHGRSGD